MNSEFSLGMDSRRRRSLKRIVAEFRNLVTAAIEPSIFDNLEPTELEKRLVVAETSIAAAAGCVSAMRRIWPEGDNVYDRFMLGLSELRRRRKFVEEFAMLIDDPSPATEQKARYAEIMAANRETLMIATTYMEEGAEILKEFTGIVLDPD